MSEKYLTPIEGARWAISRTVLGKKIYLVQNSDLDDPKDIELIFQRMGIEPTQENLDRYFPVRGAYGRCPTLELLELVAQADLTEPIVSKPVGV